MARSAFSIFRRNQWVMIAGLGVLCMIAFVILPQIEMVMGTGQQRDNKPEVNFVNLDTTITQVEMQNLVEQRHAVLKFAAMAIIKSDSTPMMMQIQMMRPELLNNYVQVMFGPPEKEHIVLTYVLAQKADELGIEVSDAAINDFIAWLTQDKLTAPEISKLASDERLTDRQLFAVLRRELKAMHTRELLLEQPPMPDFATYIRATLMQQPDLIDDGVITTPEERWEYYQRSRAKATLEVLPVKVADLAKSVADPGDKKLEEFFNKYKTNLPNPGRLDPGFKEPQRAKFEYVLVDGEHFEALAAKVPVTDEQVAEYYETNKDRLYEQRLEDTMPRYDIPTDLALPAQIDSPIPDGSGWPGGSDAGEDKESKSDDTDGKDEPKKDDAEKPSDDASKKEDASDNPEEKKESDEDDANDCFQDDTDDADAKAEKADDKAKDAEETGKEPADDANAEAEKPAEEATEPPPRKKLYKPLDDELQAEIRKQLQEEATLKQLTAEFKEIRKEMRTYGNSYFKWKSRQRDNPDLKQPEKLDLAKVAAEHGFKHEETGNWSREDAFNSKGLGTSFIVTDLASVGRSGDLFAQRMFSQLKKYEVAMAVYKETVEDPGDRFLFWKIDEAEEYVPKFEDKRDDVLAAWQTKQAREQAKELGAKFAEAAGESESLTAALESDAGKVLTSPLGTTTEKLVESVDTTNSFSWLTDFFRGRQAPSLSQVEGLENIDQHFMKRVFSSSEGDFNYSVNFPQDTLYIFRVKEMQPALRFSFFSFGWRMVDQVAQADRSPFIRLQLDQMFDDVGLDRTWRERILPPMR